MPLTARQYWRSVQGASRLNFNWDAIDRDSTVLVTASEYRPNPGDARHSPRFVGDACIKVSEISPHGPPDDANHGVTFLVTVDWPHPLPVVTDIVVLDDKPAVVQVQYEAQEIDVTWIECIYQGRAAYRQEGHHVAVRIALNPDADVTAAELATLRTTWKTGIESTWSNRFACCTSPGCLTRQPLIFEVQWDAPNPHHTVRVRRGPARSNQTTWDTQDSGDVVAHEFGHMLGHPDEYADSTCPSRSPVSTGTVMDDNTEVVQRLCEPFCARLEQSTTTV